MSSTAAASPNKKLHQIFDVISKAMGAPAKNTVSSSFNLATCFAMLADGASGPCREELVKFFGFSAVPKADGTSLDGEVGATFQQLYPKVPAAATTTTTDAAPTLASMVKTAQAIFTSASIKETYVTQVSKGYHALVGKIDHADPAVTVKAVNDFVAKATEGKIANILNAGDVDSSSVLVLVSALFFKGKWRTPFKKELTTDRPFTLSDGVTKKNVPTMFASKTKDAYLIETGSILALAIPYSGADGISFVAEAWTSESGRHGLPPSDLSNIITAATSWNGNPLDIYLPKFKIEAKASLIPALKEAGVTSIFQPSTNWQPAVGSDAIFVSLVAHRAMIEVDEEGTVAAAATATVSSRCAVAPPKVVDLNRPFHFHIVDTKNKTILFSGSCVDPTA